MVSFGSYSWAEMDYSEAARLKGETTLIVCAKHGQVVTVTKIDDQFGSSDDLAYLDSS